MTIFLVLNFGQVCENDKLSDIETLYHQSKARKESRQLEIYFHSFLYSHRKKRAQENTSGLEFKKFNE